MHWHPNADEWPYIIAGQGEATIFDTGPNVVTQNFNAGDIGYVKRRLGAITCATPARTISSISRYSARRTLPTSRCPTG